MNMLAYKYQTIGSWFTASFFVAFILLSACKKEDPVYVYEVDQVAIYDSASDKVNQKSSTEFIAIAYSDLFGENITVGTLDNLSLPYIAFGDKKVIEELIIKNFLQEPSAAIPSDQEMRSNVDAFIENTYITFYNRFPNEFESWKLKQIIEADVNMTPQIIYYAMMTSDEYRYY